MSTERGIGVTRWCLRVAIAASYLSAVADRFGLWGKPGAPGVAWGTWDAFVGYAGHLNWFLPKALHPALAGAATIAEIAIAVGLLIGWRLWVFAAASGALATTFFATMVIAGGFKAPLDYSVFTIAAASFHLATTTRRSRSTA